MNNTIIYIGGFKLPNFNASAVRVMENAHLLRKLGYEVVIVGKLQNGINSKVYEGFKCFDIIKPFKDKKYISYTKGIDSIQDIVDYIGKEHIKAIIAYNYPAFALDKINKFARKNGIIPIADCTEWYGWEGWRIDRNIKRFIDTYYRMYISAKRSGNIICAGSYLQKHFDKYNTVIWPFCVNTELERWKLPEKINLNKPRKFVYSGSPGVGMSKDKINLIIEAFYELKQEHYDFTYIILGITKEQYLKVFSMHKDMLEQLQNNILFMGRVPHKEAIKTLQDADYSIFIRPDNRVSNAGFPTKVMEAFSCGIPTITNATSDIKTYIDHGENGYIFKDTDLESIKQTIKESLSLDDETLISMKQSCRKYNPFDTKFFIDSIKLFLDKAI